MTITILSFTIVLGVLIFFHELGHFLVAKTNKVGVLVFSLGFGPAIIKKRFGETEYRLAAIPLGGYVKMLGEDTTEDEDITHIDPSRSFSRKTLKAKAAIVAAGPIFNLILAVMIYTVIAWTVAMPVLLNSIDTVKPHFPAYEAGMIKGDRIISIAGRDIIGWEDISESIQGLDTSKGSEFVIIRKGQKHILHIKPETIQTKNLFGEEIQRKIIGISPETKAERMGVIEGMGYGISQTCMIIKLTGQGFAKIIDGSIDIKESLGGPIMIADISGQTFRSGMLPFFSLIAFISINLGLINLLPIPVLDGGHLLFFLIEAIIGRPVEGRPREIAQQIGIFLLMLLMLFAFYNDIARLIANQ